MTQQSLPTTPNPVTTTRVLDAAGFLTSVTSSRNGTTLDSHSYTRDAVGNILQETIGGQTNSTSTFGYDDLYRLTSATVNGVSYGWTYDQVGNRLTQTTGSVSDTYTYDAADHLLSIDGYTIGSDLNGNVTSDVSGGTYTWDVRGRLVGRVTGKIGRIYAYQYGPDNLRVSKSVNGVLTTYLLDGAQVVTDTISGSANQTLYGPGIDHPLARNGEYFLANHQGSTTALTDSSGTVVQSYAYYPFGQRLNGTTDSNPFQFTGREDDGDSLIYYRARYYQPNWGRFISADPMSVGGLADMAVASAVANGAHAGAFLGPDSAEHAFMDAGRIWQLGVRPPGAAWSTNPFAYAGDNPVNATDPSGQLSLALELVPVIALPELAPIAVPLLGAAAVIGAGYLIATYAPHVWHWGWGMFASNGKNSANPPVSRKGQGVSNPPGMPGAPNAPPGSGSGPFDPGELPPSKGNDWGLFPPGGFIPPAPDNPEAALPDRPGPESPWDYPPGFFSGN